MVDYVACEFPHVAWHGCWIFVTLKNKSKKFIMKKRYIVLISVLVLVVAIRLALPYVTKHFINKELANIEGYHGTVDDIGMSLYRGAFNKGELVIYEEASVDPETPFVRIPHLDFSIDWRALFKGTIASDIEIEGLEVNFTVLQEEKKEEEPRLHFAEQLQELNPIEINQIKITNATIGYLDPTVSPKVDVYFENFHLRGENLSNVEDEEQVLPGFIEINSNVMGEGRLELEVHVNILKEIPDIDLNLAFEDINLVEFNDFMDAYAKLEVKSGTLSVYNEAVIKDGSISGYLKPVIEEFEVDEGGDDKNLPEKAYEAVVDFLSGILENREKERIASRVELSGHVEDVENNPWQAVFNLLRNAFIEAYSKEIENAINFGNADTGSE